MAGFQILRDRLAQLGQTVRGGIAVMPVGQRLDPRLNDMIGGFKIRLTDAKVNDVMPLCGKRIGARQNLKRALGAQTRHGCGQFQHAKIPPFKSAMPDVSPIKRGNGIPK